MSANTLLSRLDGVKPTGHGKWMARSPCRKDRTPSLSVRELEDGRTLLHDFGGASVEEVLTAVGLTFSDLYPERPSQTEGVPPVRRPWIPADAFEVARLEVGIAALIACDMRAGKTVAEGDYERLLTACSRLERIAEVAYGR